MRNLFLTLVAVALTALTGCSSDKEVADNDINTALKGRQEGFFKVGISLPTSVVSSTRAWTESGNLDDGLATEYAVNDVMLLIFDGTDESSAKLTEAIDLGTWNGSDPSDNPNQITTRKEYVAKISNKPTNNLYALAVVNHGNVISSASTAGSITVKGTTVAQPTISTINETLATSTGVSACDFVQKEGDNTYFFMTNAVLNKKQGGTVQPTADLQTLAPVDPKYIYESESAAQSGAPATDIYVERGVAKVTLAEGTDFLKATALKAADGSNLTVTASLDGWTLTNTNKSSKIIRVYDGTGTIGLTTKAASVTSDAYRFVGGNKVDPNVNLYRTYWATDPNYSEAWANTNFATAAEADFKTAKGDNNPQYCFENTFNVANQTYKNSTSVVLKVQLTSGGTDFYTVGADRKTLYSLGGVKDMALNYLKSQSAFSTWFTNNGTGTLAANDITVTFDKTTAGKLTVESITIPAANTKDGTDKVIDANTADATDVISTLNNQLSNVELFKGGVSYYTLRIKHFGDDLTPWNDGEFKTGYEPKEDTTDKIYPAADDTRQNANYLGRYGMVRNNWYALTISDILKVGSPTAPDFNGGDTPDHPDDGLDEAYIKARINILSWAKRNQNWQLKQ